MFNVKVITLITLSFALGTCEYVVIGILPDIAADLNVPITQAGLLVSVFAVVYAVGAPLITAYVSRFPRRRTTLVFTAMFIIGNIGCMAAPSYSIMAVSRVFLAMVSSTLVSLSMTFAPDVAPRKYTPSIVSWIFAGFNIASVVGVPISMFITQFTSWRVSFGLIALVSLVLFALMYRHLPAVNPPPRSGIVQQMVLLKDSRIVMAVLTMVLSASASYCFYTYLTPLLSDKMMLSPELLSIAFIVFGVAAIISNLASPLLMRLGGMRMLWWIFAIQAIFSLLLTFTMNSLLLGGITVFALGVLMYLLNTPTQLYFLEVSRKFHPGTLALAASLTPSSYNVGIALGSFSGSFTVGNFGLGSVGIAGAFFAVLAALVSFALASRIKRRYRAAIKRAEHIKQVQKREHSR